MAWRRRQEKLPADDTYVVQRGDTLAGVALRLGVKQSELKRANHMYGSRTLVAGQVICAILGTPCGDVHPVFEEGATCRVSVKSRVFAVTSLKRCPCKFNGRSGGTLRDAQLARRNSYFTWPRRGWVDKPTHVVHIYSERSPGEPVRPCVAGGERRLLDLLASRSDTSLFRGYSRWVDQ